MECELCSLGKFAQLWRQHLYGANSTLIGLDWRIVPLEFLGGCVWCPCGQRSQLSAQGWRMMV